MEVVIPTAPANGRIHALPDIVFAGNSFEIDLEDDDSVTLFALIGEAYVGEDLIPNFAAGLVADGGNKLVIENKSEEEAAILFFSSKRIEEPVAWPPGPIVMNTQEEIDQAHRDLKDGTFLKEKITMDKE